MIFHVNVSFPSFLVKETMKQVCNLTKKENRQLLLLAISFDFMQKKSPFIEKIDAQYKSRSK